MLANHVETLLGLLQKRAETTPYSEAFREKRSPALGQYDLAREATAAYQTAQA